MSISIANNAAPFLKSYSTSDLCTFAIATALTVEHTQGFDDWATAWLSGTDRSQTAAMKAYVQARALTQIKLELPTTPQSRLRHKQDLLAARAVATAIYTTITAALYHSHTCKFTASTIVISLKWHKSIEGDAIDVSELATAILQLNPPTAFIAFIAAALNDEVTP